MSPTIRTRQTEHATFALRAATASDGDFLCRLVATNMCEYVAAVGVWDEYWQAHHFRANFDAACWQMIVVDGQDAGGFAVDRHPQVLFLADLHLLPAYQGRGIGSALIASLIAEARDILRVPLALYVLTSNPRARCLYERHGLSVTASCSMPGYVVMQTGTPRPRVTQ